MTKRKILYSPGYGACWTTWHHGSRESRLFMLEWAPAIEAIEAGTFNEPRAFNDDEVGPLAQRFLVEFKERFPHEDTPYMGGFSQLKVAEVSGPVCITEYDGSEDYVEACQEEYL